MSRRINKEALYKELERLSEDTYQKGTRSLAPVYDEVELSKQQRHEDIITGQKIIFNSVLAGAGLYPDGKTIDYFAFLKNQPLDPHRRDVGNSEYLSALIEGQKIAWNSLMFTDKFTTNTIASERFDMDKLQQEYNHLENGSQAQKALSDIIAGKYTTDEGMINREKLDQVMSYYKSRIEILEEHEFVGHLSILEKAANDEYCLPEPKADYTITYTAGQHDNYDFVITGLRESQLMDNMTHINEDIKQLYKEAKHQGKCEKVFFDTIFDVEKDLHFDTHSYYEAQIKNRTIVDGTMQRLTGLEKQLTVGEISALQDIQAGKYGTDTIDIQKLTDHINDLKKHTSTWSDKQQVGQLQFLEKYANTKIEKQVPTLDNAVQELSERMNVTQSNDQTNI